MTNREREIKIMQDHLNEKLSEQFMCMGFGVLILLMIAVILLSSCREAHAYTQEEAVRAIIGEASSEGYEGMLAVACAIRNRGTLKGVYGLKAKHVDSQPQWVWDRANKAWAESASIDVTKGATHWHNLKREGENYWTKKLVKTVEIKNHVFYKEKVNDTDYGCLYKCMNESTYEYCVKFCSY